MLLDSPGIALTAQGQALEAGAIGERIRVLNPVSRAVLEAEVIGPGRVRVAPDASPRRSRQAERAIDRRACRRDCAPRCRCCPAARRLRFAVAAVGSWAGAGDDADRGSDQGSDLAAGQHADAGAGADAERGELAVAQRLARVLQGSARGAGRRHRHHPGQHERRRQPEECHDRQPHQRRERRHGRTSSACRRCCRRRSPTRRSC